VLCLIGFDDNPVIKDFIRIHAELLRGKKLLLTGGFPDYRLEGINIRKKFDQPAWLRRAISMLPYWYVARRQERRRTCVRATHAALGRFFRHFGVDVIVAEFGDAGAAVAPVAAECRIPLVVHFHGHDAHRQSLLNEELLRKYRFMFQSAAAVLVVSRFMWQTLSELGCPPEKLIYNPYGPREKFFEVVPDYGPRVLSVGRFTDIKANYLVLMAFQQAMRKVPNARLIMAGDGELLETCRTLAKAWQIEKSVEFLGAVPHARVHELFARACCFAQHSVMPSYGDAEGTPNTILEAGAAALPVVATRHAGIPDIVVDGETGFLSDERDVESMANNLVRMLSDPKTAESIGSTARQRIREKFSTDSHICRLESAIVHAVRKDSKGISDIATQSLLPR
jgi:colanic acid/amylovoran biosynthesis glycosyltransferase